MIIRKIEEQDLPEVSRWFESTSWDLPPVEGAIPPDGFVAVKDGKLVACAWIYVTGSACSFVQWTNTNEEIDEKLQSDGVTAIFKHFQEISSHLTPPIKAIVTYTKSEKFKEKLKGLGFRSSFGFYQCTWVGKKNAAKEA
jgi:hypothetical protein